VTHIRPVDYRMVLNDIILRCAMKICKERQNEGKKIQEKRTIRTIIGDAYSEFGLRNRLAEAARNAHLHDQARLYIKKHRASN